jgi:hypothetical protein
VALHLVAATDQDIVASFAGDHQIIGDKSVTALDEVEHALGFSDAALAGEKQSDTENVSQ